MGRITDIKPQRRSGRVNIYIDEEFAVGVSDEERIRLGLKIGDEADAQTLSKLVIADNTRAAVNKALNLLKYRARTEKEIRQALERAGFDDTAADAAIEKLERYGYVDDSAFADMYAGYAKSKGMSRRELNMRLTQKGIDRDEAERAAEAISGEDERAAAYQLALKYYNKAKGELKQKRDKAAQALFRKGFEWDTIRSVLDEVTKDDCE
ncbi:MAG: regulatory protein RecX [Christensenellales bacterium]|jgi:regulatory protein